MGCWTQQLRCLVSSLVASFYMGTSLPWPPPITSHRSNHPFIDGNKRVAVMAALVFLHVNGIEKLPAPEALEITTRQVAAGELSKDALTQWLRAQIGKRK